MEEKELKRAVELIRGNRRYVIACHARPDGDTLGSALALAIALRGMDKSVVVLAVDGVPDNYSFLPESASVVKDTAERGFDVAIVTDCDGLERVGDAVETVKSARYLISIDHHGSNPPFGHVQLYDSTSASTGEIVLELLNRLGVTLNREIADCLMTAVVSDTGAFRFPNVTPSTFLAAARIATAGASASRIAQLIYETKSFESTRLLGVALASLESFDGGQIVSARLSKADFESTGTTAAETEGVIDHIRAIKDVKVALLFREAPDGSIVVSLRSKGSIDVAALAQVFEGGGHRAAAGCTIQASLEEAERMVIEEARKCMAS
jgi:bifunctional oligoribonuclease and PAP phosphatase NrnA